MSKRIDIEPLTPAHWESVRAIYLEGIATGQATFEVDAPSWDEWDSGHHTFCRLVARVENRIAGWAALSPVSRRSCYAGVAEASIYVAANQRGRGIGKALLQALMAESEHHGIWTLQGATFPENEGSLRLLQSCGFRTVGRRERIGQLHGFWRDTIITERRMQSPTQTDLKTPFDDGVLYDIVLGDISYGRDFYVSLAREARGPVLDVACGTGRVLLPCLQAGLDIEGLDLFGGMLAQLRKKAQALGLQPRLHQADMRSFQLERRYSLIMIPFNAIVHCLTTEEQLATLRCCRDHLQLGGMLAFDTYFPGAAILTTPNNARVLEGETPHPETGLPVRLFDTRSFNLVEQQQHSLMDIEFLDAAGNVTATHRSETTVRWIYKSEMALLLRAAGFGRFEIAGDFDGRPLIHETDAMIVKAWKTSTP